jgi:phage internal scaffolding protein
MSTPNLFKDLFNSKSKFESTSASFDLKPPVVQQEFPIISSSYSEPIGDHSYVEKHKSLTQQAHKDACDINIIMKRPDIDDLLLAPMPTYADVSDSLDYHKVMNILTESVATFAKLPQEIRERFDGDHMKLIEFLNDPANEDEAIVLGLAITVDTKDPSLRVVVDLPVDDKSKGNPKVNPPKE